MVCSDVVEMLEEFKKWCWLMENDVNLIRVEVKF